jgi:hypothetical protein
MELRNGVIHIKVNLKLVSEKKKHLEMISNQIKNLETNCKHFKGISLAIPSEMSPRLAKVKENICSKVNSPRHLSTHDNQKANKKLPVFYKNLPKNKKNHKPQKKISRDLNYYNHIFSLPNNLDEISSHALSTVAISTQGSPKAKLNPKSNL